MISSGRFYSMIRKVGLRFSEKIILNQKQSDHDPTNRIAI